MPQDVGPSIDRSALVDGQQADAADVKTPLDNTVTVINNILNGNQEFDAIDLNGDSRTVWPTGLIESVAVMWDEKATTTDGGGSSAATWNNRDLNTEHYDPDAIVAISSNQFTPVSGDYLLYAAAPAFEVNLHRLRLFNVTGAAAVQEGINQRNDGSTGNVSTTATVLVQFTANGTDAYRIDHYTQAARATVGLGPSVDDGSPEIYLTILLLKLT